MLLLHGFGYGPHRRKGCLTLVLLVASTFACAGSARASFAQASVDLFAKATFPSPVEFHGYNSGASSAFFTDSQSFTIFSPPDSMGNFVTASFSLFGLASANPTPGHFLVADAAATAFTQFFQAGVQAGSSADAQANWSDKIILQPTGTSVPSYVRLSFAISGSVDVSQSGFSQGSFAGVEARWTSSSLPTGSGRGSIDPIIATLPTDPILFSSGNWDSATITGVSFYATFHSDVSLNADALGNLVGNWKVDLRALAQSHFPGSPADTDPPTSSFLSVLLPDGKTPESEGFGVSFESGMPSPNAAVPEPASLTLLGLGALGLIGHRWRRRPKANA